MFYIPPAPAQEIRPLLPVPLVEATTTVPFYSQFRDITATSWKKVGCGITSLAMIINYYEPGTVTVDALLTEGIAAHAYQKNAGWIHAGLITLGTHYGLTGKAYYGVSIDTLATSLKEGPVIASVHYKLDPKNPIPHMIVVTRIEDDVVYYNDPAAQRGDKEVSVRAFSAAWKKRFIAIRPTVANSAAQPQS